MSERIVKAREEKSLRIWIPLPEEIREALDLSIGDWVLLKRQEEGVLIEKVNTEEIEVEIEMEIIELARTVRDIEGYYTTEETLSNMIRKGLAILLREEGEKKRAEELENSWMLQVHP
ncbi:hypothetical protein AKJ61_02395 [candidate division MSBL1 archaeon SCGC-AAA259B11]|uniref:SpoVT-AbrB domain-containing protein n=1 Tax=candidate division MSBL1 archaeon SCGC-AAA259B11 TaxID=1698260 RepID=A0A133U674_9EURY|nr:hypothetical protein AKJ61_02395 [candidate division MSBL1 archaeon SCGC-AAA259B11]